MPRNLRPLFAIALVAAAGAALAQTAPGPEETVAARQAHMKAFQEQLMVLGPMAQGRTGYDAAAAQAAAARLAELSGGDQSIYWLPGTSNADVAASKTLPAALDNLDEILAQTAALHEAALAAAAATDLAGLQAAMGAIGASCGACHQTYRTR